MKRASRNYHRQYTNNNNNSVYEKAKATIKHQNPLRDFLKLQKEFVSKKKTLETINQMRGTLLNEIRFLRQSYNYLSMSKSQEYELQQDSIQPQTPFPQSKRTKKHGVDESIERIPSYLPNSYLNAVHEEEGGRSHVDVQALSRKGKKPQKCLINGKRVEKRKI